MIQDKLSFKILLWKSYFDKGMGLTNYLKYVIAFFGMASLNVKATMIIAGIYAIFCLVLGWIWYRFGIINIENEVGNQFNPFCEDVRKHLCYGKI